MKKNIFIISICIFLFYCNSSEKADSDEYLFPIITGDKYGYINIQGKVIVEPIYKYGSNFKNGFAVISDKRKYGYIKNNGKFLTSLKFDKAYGFSDNLACVKIDGKYGFIDTTGEIVIEPKFDKIISYSPPNIDENEYGFKDGLAAVCIDDKWGYINKSGKVVVDIIYEKCSDFRNGIAKVKINEKWYYLKKEGFKKINSIARPSSNFSSSSLDSVAVAFVDEGYVLINRDGDIISKIDNNLDLTRYWDFYNNLLVIQDKNTHKYGYLDTTGKLRIKPVFDEVTTFIDNVAAVIINGKYGCIDTTGKILFRLDEEYTMPSDAYYCLSIVSEGLLMIAKDDGEQYVSGFANINGEIVIEPQFAFASPFEHGLSLVGVGIKPEPLKYGYINKKGEFVWEPTF